MDNKNNRLFYWEVKDFLTKKTELFESKKDSLKDSINQILNENKTFRQSSFVNNPKVTDAVKSQIELISVDEKKYISESTKTKTNSLSNPFNLVEAPVSLPAAPAPGLKTSFKVSSPGLASSVFSSEPTEEDDSRGGLNTPISAEPEETETKEPTGAYSSWQKWLDNLSDKNNKTLSNNEGAFVSPEKKAPSEATPAPEGTPSKDLMGLGLPVVTPGVTPTYKAPSADTGFDFTKAGTGMGTPEPTSSEPEPKEEPTTKSKAGSGAEIAAAIAKARREANIARNRISYETDSAKKQQLRDIADSKFAALRDIESDYEVWKSGASAEERNAAKSLEGPSSFPDAGAQRDYQSNLRRMQDEYAKRIKDSKNAPKIYADAAKKKEEAEARKTPAERAKRLKMAEAVAKNMGMSIEDLLKTSEFFKSEYGYLFQK